MPLLQFLVAKLHRNC